jgi:transposase
MREPYATDLSDTQWSRLRSYLPTPNAQGRPRLQGMEARRHLGEDESGDAAPFERETGPRSRAQRGHRRCAVGQDHRGRRRAEGLRRGKKVRGRKRHLLVDTEGLVVEARVHSARVPDQDGIRRLLEPAHSRLPRLSYLWVDAGYRGRGKEWVERELGVEVEVVNRSPKPTPEKILRVWAREWFKEGHRMDLGKLPTRPGFENLPRRWVAERTFAWLSHNRRMAKDYERLCATGEAFIHVAMTRLMIRKLARG